MAKQQDDLRNLNGSVVVDSVGAQFRGTQGDDHLVGTKHADTFNMRQGGNDFVNAGQGHDTIYMGATLTADDRINGGAGADTLVLDGDYSSGLALQTETISRIEFMDLRGDFGYSITMAPDMREDRNTFRIDATQAASVHFDGSAMDFNSTIVGSSGDDVLIGGSGINGFAPGAGHDILTGGSGVNQFLFTALVDSTPSNADVITNFDVNNDSINLAEIDADPKMKGFQSFHFGSTPGHVGDIALAYDAGQNITYVNMFTNKDDIPDMVINLLGDHTDLTSANFFGVDSITRPIGDFDHTIHLPALELHLPIA